MFCSYFNFIKVINILTSLTNNSFLTDIHASRHIFAVSRPEGDKPFNWP